MPWDGDPFSADPDEPESHDGDVMPLDQSSLEESTRAAVRAAAGHLTPSDQGAIAAILRVARKIDRWTPETNDNVSAATYLKYAESLGLTPAGRVKMQGEKGRQVNATDELQRVDVEDDDGGGLTLVAGPKRVGPLGL